MPYGAMRSVYARVVEAWRVGKRIAKGVARRGARKVEIDAGILGHAEIPVGARVLHAVERLAKQCVVRFLAVEQEIDCLAHLLVLNLAVKILVDDLGALLGSDIGQQIRAQIARDGNVIGRPGIARCVDEPRVQAQQHKYADDKDAYLDEQIALYKQEKYRPMAGVIPLLIQIPIIFGLIDVIYRPLTHILHLSQPLVSLLCAKAEAIVGMPLSSSPELKVVELMTTQSGVSGFLSLDGAGVAEAVNAVRSMDLRFLGIDLAKTPSLAHIDLLWTMPVLAGLSAWLMCFFQNRVNVLQIEQNRFSKVSMTLFMIAFSAFFACIVPTGVGLYWIAGNLLSIPSMYLLNLIMNPKKYIDYQQMETIKRLNAEKETRLRQNVGRARADYKRFYDDALRITEGRTESKYSYSEIATVSDDERYVLLWLNGENMVLRIPKAALQDIGAFRSFVSGRMADSLAQP